MARFITFEGGEGTGKSTQARRLVEKLESMGVGAQLTREPGGTPLAERIRGLLLDGTFKACGPDVEAVLFAAARSDHIHKAILPIMEEGDTVVCDRFFDSTRVYQALGGASTDLLDRLRQEATAGFAPDLTVILDLDVDIAAQRRVERQGSSADRFEAEGLEFHRAVRQGFLDIARSDSDRCVLVSADADLETVTDRVWSAVLERLPDLISHPALDT